MDLFADKYEVLGVNDKWQLAIVHVQKSKLTGRRILASTRKNMYVDYIM